MTRQLTPPRSLALTLAWLTLVTACATPPATPTQAPPPATAAFLLTHGGLRLALDRRLRARITLAGDNGVVQLSAPNPLPLVAVTVNGKPWAPFKLDPGATQARMVRGPLGQGRSHTLHARASSGDQALGLRLQLTIYADFPRAIFTRLELRNLGQAPISIDRVLHNRVLLSGGTPRWAFQGAAVQWGRDAIFALKPGYSGRNFFGAVNGDLGGGGIPLNDLWTRRGGLAVGHIAPGPRALFLPLEVDREGRAATWIEQRGKRLPAGQQLVALPGMIIGHQRDFFAPLEAYRRVLARQGAGRARPPASAYEPVWCSWGYEFDVRPAEILGILPKLVQLGLRWVVLDDRWFETYGDWRPRAETFGADPDAAMRKLVAGIHARGLLARLWWIPLLVEREGARYESHPYRTAAVLQQHPDWLVLDRSGKPARGPRDLRYLCPALPGVQRHVRLLTERFVRDWGFDGHKLDVVFTVPPCHNPAHQHQRPRQSTEAMATVYRQIFDTTRRLKPHGVTEVCPCGTTPHHLWLPYINQAVTADPVGAAQMRRRVKLLKALMGPRFAVYADHVELTTMHADERETGDDFATAIGTGAVVGTKFIWPTADPRLRWGGDRLLTPRREQHWKRWLQLYNEKGLARGEYLNLYDLAFDRPEAHVVRGAGGRLHYAFYADRRGAIFDGVVRFNGPLLGQARVFDYVNRQVLGVVSPARRQLKVRFAGSLLVELIPLPR